MNTTFFTQLTELMKDRQEMRLTIKKVGDDFSIIAVPNFKDEGKHIYINGSPSELDEKFLEELGKPLKVEGSFSSNAEEVANEVKEEAEDNKPSKQTDTGKSKSTTGKSPAKKPAKRSAATKKTKKEEPIQTNDQHENDLEEALQPESEPGEETKEHSEGTIANAEIPDPAAGTPMSKEEEQERATAYADARASVSEEEEAANIDKLFDGFMEEGKRLHADRKYTEAVSAFTSAVELKPNHKLANTELKKSTQWAKAVSGLPQNNSLTKTI